MLLLFGRRDKYMFHQANLVRTEWTSDPTDPLYVSPRPTDNPSLMEYWYFRVLSEMGKYINTAIFPVEVRSPRVIALRVVSSLTANTQP